MKKFDEWLSLDKSTALLVDGARQIGKSYLIREFGKTRFKDFVEINLRINERAKTLFQTIEGVDDLVMKIRLFAQREIDLSSALIFFDEIQSSPDLFPYAKMLAENHVCHIAFAGSLLGVTLEGYASDPLGFVTTIPMYPMDFEEFLWANGVDESVIEMLRGHFISHSPVDEGIHKTIMGLFRRFLIVGGMPDAVKEYLSSRDTTRINLIKENIHRGYREDAAQYSCKDKLIIQEIYDLMPSQIENKNRRFILKKLNEHQRYSRYENDFQWLCKAGIALKTDCVSDPVYPLITSESRNLFKLYFSDVGILSLLLFKSYEDKILIDERSANLGAIYENVVATELLSKGFPLYYYDSKKRGEVDFIVELGDRILPLEVKSGRDYTIHSALINLLNDYPSITEAIVFHNENVKEINGKTYLPIYMVMFLEKYPSRSIKL